MENNALYPMLFRPILKSLIWGGERICKFKDINPPQSGIGESWEISHVADNISVVSNGFLAGRNLDELVKLYGSKLVGEKNLEKYNGGFPLLIKFIDATDSLSIQVHPDDALARARHNSFGKTEMWYVVEASEGASLYSGFSREISKEEYVRRVADNTIEEVLRRYEVKAGDVFFLPAGRVHAICKGCFIAEIQQSSNITYRIYDYNRKDADGNGRELHTELAKDAIDFSCCDTRTEYSPLVNEPVLLAQCNYFTTRLITATQICKRDLSRLDSFIIYICIKGQLAITDNKKNVIDIKQGETVLLPADTESVELKPQTSETTVIEIHA